MNYADIRPIDVANGPGVRVSLFVSGCTHHCEGCFNPETWDFHYGKPFGPEQEEEILSALSRPYIHGLSLLGGEPMEPENQPAILRLVRRVRERFPDKDIWCYSGYLFPRLAAGGGAAQPGDSGAAGRAGGRPLRPGPKESEHPLPGL